MNIINWFKNIFKSKEKMSFKEGLDLTELPVVTFKQGNKKLNFMLDTGANKSIINSKVLSSIEYQRLKEDCALYGLEGNTIRSYYAGIIFEYKGKKYADAMQVVDMSAAFDHIKQESGVTLHGLIGNEFMQRYKYVLDFKEMVAYSKQ